LLLKFPGVDGSVLVEVKGPASSHWARAGEPESAVRPTAIKNAASASHLIPQTEKPRLRELTPPTQRTRTPNYARQNFEPNPP